MSAYSALVDEHFANPRNAGELESPDGEATEESKALTREQLAEGIGGLPSHKVHCSVLAADALRAAVEDYESRS